MMKKIQQILRRRRTRENYEVGLEKGKGDPCKKLLPIMTTLKNLYGITI